MSPEQMVSLFAGFVAASGLIWVSNLVASRKTRREAVYSKLVFVDPDKNHSNKTNPRQDTRIQESFLNVSTFFGLRR
jgi:hypothetical protein